MSEEAIKKIHELFKDCFIQNCTLDEDEVNETELETLDGLEPEEVYENLKELLTTLIQFKKSIKNSEVKELTQRLLIFEKMIQKLESDIRSHISVQHQMRLDMETYELKIEELQKLKTYHVKKIEDLDKLVVDKESEILKIKNKNVIDLEIKLKGIEEKFKQEIASAMDYYRKENSAHAKDFERNAKEILADKDRELEKLKLGNNFSCKELSVKTKKARFSKIPKEGLTDRAKRTKKSSTATAAELFKTIETIPRKIKHESPYLKKEMIHIRSSSDIGQTQKHKLTIL